MEDIILRYIIWIGIIIAIGIIVLLSSNEIDIKIAVWFRLIMSLFILVLGNILLYKYYHSIGSLVVLKIISMILIVYACLDIPAKLQVYIIKESLLLMIFQ